VRLLAALSIVMASAASVAADPADVPAPESTATTEATSAAPPTEQDHPSTMLESVVVTAQRRRQSASDVPLAISAFRGEDLQALGVTDTRDLGRIVPGFTAADSGGNTPVYTLRGVGFNDQTYTATSTVGVYVDEVPLPYSVMTKGTNLDLQRVEVLKGPQGTLYGRNTTGGAINYIANKPTYTFEGGLNGTYGRFQTAELDGFLSGPIADTLRGRIAVRGDRSWEGWQYSNTSPADHLGKLDKQSLRALLDWTPVNALAVHVSISGWRDGSDAQAPQAIYLQPQNAQVGSAALAPQVRNYPLVDPNTDDMRVADWEPKTDWALRDRYWQGSARADWSFSESTTLTALYSHGDMKSDGSMLPQSGFNFYNAEQQLFATVATDALELRLAGKVGEGINWLIGANGARDKGHELHKLFTDTVSSLFPNPVTGESTLANRVDTYGDNNARTYGIFANGDWQIVDWLQFSLGARYSDEDREFSGCTFEDPSSQGAGLGPVITAVALTRGNVLVVPKGDCFTLNAQGSNALFHGDLHENSLSYRSALSWTPARDLLFYVSYTRGYKSGGFPVLNASDQSQFAPVTQERLLAKEIGGKLSLLHHHANIDFAAFDYDYKDKQLLTRKFDQVFGPVPVLRNAPASTVRGVELDLKLSPLNGLFLSGAAAYVFTRIDQFIGTGFDGSDVDFSGHPFNFAPRLQYTALGDYSLIVGGSHIASISADYSHTGTTNSTLEENPHYAHRAFGIVNARLRWRRADGAWSAMVWGRNLTNQFSQVSIFNIGDAVSRYTGMPRTYGVSLSCRFE
jgi:outer membrane receptor protein involved in Fe transport